jgi:hypothetical protein
MKEKVSAAIQRREVETPKICELCKRNVSHTSRHHLVPKSQGGTLTADLCSACHKTLHKFFTNRTLARELSTLESLQSEPEITRFLAWVRKQPDRKIKIHENKKRR